MRCRIGGIESYMINVLKNINHNEFMCEYMTSDPNESIISTVESLGGIVHRIPSSNNLFGYISSMNKLMKSDFDVVHIHKNSAINIIPLILAKKNKIKKIIFHSHNTAETRGYKIDFLHTINRKYILRNSDILLACSRKAAEWMYGSSDNITVINNGIELEKFKFNQSVRDRLDEN